MNIVYKTGDLLDCPENIIVHGCNASGTAYSSGVAGQMRRRFPFAYHAYYAAKPDDLQLGKVIWAIDTRVSRVIGNAITQQEYGRSGRRYVEYEAIELAVKAINQFVIDWRERASVPNISVDRVAFPEIGAGLGGGNWSVISEIIAAESHAFQPVVYRLK